MSSSPASGVLNARYATALFESGAADQEATKRDATALLALCGNDVFRYFLSNPTLSRAEQIAALRAFVPAGVVQAFAVRVAKNRRLSALPGMLKAYLEYVAASRGEVDVVVETPYPLLSPAVTALTKGFGTSLKKTVRLTVNEVPELLGGLRVRVGNSMIDYSAASALDRLGAVLTSTPLSTTGA